MLTEYPIIARDLTYKAGFKTIIEDFDIVLKKNEFVGLIGGSGSGKTTLLTCLNGYREATDGSVTLNGIPVDEKDKVNHLIGYVPQDDIVHRTLKVESALYYSYLLRIRDDLPEEKIRWHITKILAQLNLKDHKNKKIASLSGGQRKRVNIGVELLHSPPLFFLDEPTSGLDPSLERRLMRLLRSLADENRLIIITTHLMQNVDMFDVLIFIHKGRMVYCGPSEEITAFFRAKDMIDLFDKIAAQDPLALRNKYVQSTLYHSFLAPRLSACKYVQ
jgi:ABC-type multidrug transport system ATPase subunit